MKGEKYIMGTFGWYDLSQTPDPAPVLESYKTMKMTWDKVERIAREYTDRIETTENLRKVIILEREYMEKLNEFYDMIDNDDLNFKDNLVRRFIPTMITIIGATASVLSISLMGSTSNPSGGANPLITLTGLGGVGLGIGLKKKFGNTKTFKKTSLESIQQMKDALKTDININNVLVNAGINTRTEAKTCTISIDNQTNKLSIYKMHHEE